MSRLCDQLQVLGAEISVKSRPGYKLVRNDCGIGGGGDQAMAFICDQCWRLSITCGSDLDWKGGALKNNWLLLAAKYFASLFRPKCQPGLAVEPKFLWQQCFAKGAFGFCSQVVPAVA